MKTIFYLPTQIQDRLYFGLGDGTFEKAIDWLPTESLLSVGGSAADFDGDGDIDIYITTNYSADRLYRNEGDHFVDISTDAGIIGEASDTATAVWGDYDLDGDLDLFVGGHLDTLFEGSQSDPDYVFPEAASNVLYTNNGDGTFHRNIIHFSHRNLLLWQPPFYSMKRPDLYLVNDFGPLVIGNRLLRPSEEGFVWSQGNSRNRARYVWNGNITGGYQS